LDRENRVMSYACTSPQSSILSFRYVRLTQTGPTASGDNHLVLSKLEFFGLLTTCPH
jgi:hypothetical protein